jgi:hypothetical protein
VVFIAIAGAIFFYCRRRGHVRGAPERSTVNDDSQALHRESIVSGASQTQSVGSPVTGESSISHSGSGGMGGMQALPIVSAFNTISHEPLSSPSSASPVHGASQPHMEVDRQSVPNYVTIPSSLSARSSPTQMTTDVRSSVVLVVLVRSCASIYLRSQTPNFTTSYPSYPEPSRGAPPVPSVPSKLPTSLYTASVSALTNKQTRDQGKYHDPPIA